MAWYFLGSAYFMLTTKTLTGYDLGWEICAWSYFLSSIHDRCSEETCQSFESRSKRAYYTSRTWDLTDLLMESCNDINLFPGSCLIACVADTLNLLYTNGLDEYVGRLQRRLLPHSLPSVLLLSSRWPTTGGRCGPSAAQGHCVFFFLWVTSI